MNCAGKMIPLNKKNRHLPSLEKYLLIAENALDMIAIIDPESQFFTYVSPANLKTMGYSEEEFLSRSCLDNVHPDDREDIRLKLLTAIKYRLPGKAECRCLRKDGSYLWLETSGRLYESPGGKIEILLISRDISARKLMEQKLHRQLDYHYSLINNMNEWFCTYDSDCHFTYVNKKAIECTGYSLEELLNISIFDLVIPEQHDFIARKVQERFKGGGPGSYELWIRCKNGKKTLLRIKTSPIIESSGINGAIILAEDISEQRRMEKEMNRLANLYRVGEMAAGMGYEVNSPLNAVSGLLQLLQKSNDFEQYNCYFETMLEEIDRANIIINEFLKLAQNRLMDLYLHDLNHIIESLYPLLQADAVMTDTTIVLELGAIPDLFLDEKEIGQLVLNLIRNSLETIPTGGKVTITTWCEEKKVMLEVSNESKKKVKALEKLNAPFYSSSKKGSGLRLAVCYKIVARHQAYMEEINCDGMSCFRVGFKVPQKQYEAEK